MYGKARDAATAGTYFLGTDFPLRVSCAVSSAIGVHIRPGKRSAGI